MSIPSHGFSAFLLNFLVDHKLRILFFDFYLCFIFPSIKLRSTDHQLSWDASSLADARVHLMLQHENIRKTQFIPRSGGKKGKKEAGLQHVASFIRNYT